ncbi:MAG TPA: succinylglutamate desuccinylase/aspartoacylase family protein [Patescibacteria group bacterium]|nr:succinylglutamate desuccinylase/aspartoacylase family protein [Patescibacteria group bacterium]
MLDTEIFEGRNRGPNLLVFGAIHGNEKCGTHAIGRAIMELRSAVFKIEKGRVIFVPICHPEAYRADQRYIEVNLNRVIRKHPKVLRHEHALANELTALIDKCDVLLDLHSYSSGRRPFLFLDNDTPEQREFAAAMNIPYWVTGWNDVYAEQQDMSQGDTTSYAFSQKKMALLIECGLHEDPQSAVVGYKSLRAALAYYGMAEPYERHRAEPPSVMRMTNMLVKQREGRFLKDWQHLDPVSKGMPILRYDDGDIYMSPVDGVVLLPGKKTRIGEEWVYFGVESK